MVRTYLPILILALSLHGCSSAPRPLTKMEEFDLKTRCASYADRIEKRALALAGHESLAELFYTCVAAFRTTIGDTRGFALLDVLQNTEYFFDESASSVSFHNEVGKVRNPNVDKEWEKARKDWEAKIEELKANDRKTNNPN